MSGKRNCAILGAGSVENNAHKSCLPREDSDFTIWRYSKTELNG
jgi:hypothetical protein